MRSAAGFEFVSRESFLLFNNILLACPQALVFLDALAPLIPGRTGTPLGQYRGNPSFMLPMVPLLALVALGVHSRWKRGGLREARKPLLVTLAVALVIALLLVFAVYGVHLVMTPIAATLGLWIILSSLVDPIDRLRRRLSLPASLIGMTVAHIGLGVFVLGILHLMRRFIELDVALKPSAQSAQVGHYRFQYLGVQSVVGPNYDATRGTVSVTRAGRLVTVLHPEKKHYFVQGSEITTAAIAAGLPRDLLAALGDDVGNGAYSLRFQYRPLIRLVWLGGVIMALGGTIAVIGRRRRLREELAAHASAAAAGGLELALPGAPAASAVRGPEVA